MNENEKLLSSPLLLAVLNASTDAVVLIDTSGVIVSVNEMTTRMFGHSAKSLVGSNVSMLMPERYRLAHDVYLKQFPQTLKSKVKGKKEKKSLFVFTVWC